MSAGTAIRTPLRAVWSYWNDFAVNELMRLVDQTTPEDPCVPIPH